MTASKTSGFVLKAIDYRDFDRIITVFTTDYGLLKLILPGARRKKNPLAAISQPLTEAEFIFLNGKSEMHRCTEASLLGSHLSLRKTLSRMQAALDLCKVLLRTQVPEKPALQLFSLFSYCLTKLEQGATPELVHLLFQLRTLRHEGLISWQAQCPACSVPLLARHYSHGEAFCEQHAPPGSVPFSPRETEALHLLSHEPSFSALEELAIGEVLPTKIKDLFADCISLRI